MSTANTRCSSHAHGWRLAGFALDPARGDEPIATEGAVCCSVTP
ncbi:hypothetical protein DB30_02779 [Enhygromyxa salina]|uniref:Uncharacterized protein n=1 Tax=Enhygromyxa salina TaxID=215803 RepID=A0A0C2D3G4_9BACT|nr:hypothetical protein DB30_02779 [Enhygromyxa salina]